MHIKTAATVKIIRRRNEVSTKGKRGRNKSKGQMKERDKRARERRQVRREKGSRGVENGEEIAERERVEREA